MQSAVDQWLALRYLAVTSMFMCIATVTGLFTSEIGKFSLELKQIQMESYAVKIF